ncbi:MAG: RNA 2',3'-cyclic phosphodiesterase [Planctomycetota bacterium]|jgi:2'-5' RNA ligase
MLRLFIAIELDEDIRAELFEEIKYLKSHFPDIRWVKPENLHITMKFLGNVGENEIEDISAIMDSAAEKTPSFSAGIENLGCFPDTRHPRIVWAGCGQGNNEIKSIVGNLDEELKLIGYKPENRKFTPHITIGRVKRPSHAMGIEEIINDAQQIDFGLLDVSALTLFMSELKKEGPRYSAMYRAELS